MNQRLATWGQGVLAGLLLAFFDVGLFLSKTVSEFASDDMLRIGAVTLLTGALSGLVVGVLLAPLARRRPRQGRRAMGGILLIFGLLCVYLDGTLYVNLYTWAHWCLGITALVIGVYGVQMFALGTWTRWLSVLALLALVLSPWLGSAAFGPGHGVRRAVFQETTLVGRTAALWPTQTQANAPDQCDWPAPELPPKTGLKKHSILLVTIDAWRADLADLYLAKSMPKLAKAVGGSTRFTRAYAAATRTNESIYSLLTGHWPHRLNFVPAGVDKNDDFRQVDDTYSLKQTHQLPLHDRTPTLAESLADHGYATAAIVPYVFFLKGAGITRGFRDVDIRAYTEANRGNRGVTSQILTDQGIQWISKNQGPWMMWIHYLDPHSPYDPYGGVSPDAPMFDRYVSELKRVDDQLDRLISHLRTAGKLKDTIIVIAADHGEEFRDHGGLFHGTTVYEEQARIPLFVGGPGIGRRIVERPVSLVDVAPTLLDLVGATAGGPMDGRSLAPHLRGTQARPKKRPLLIQSTRKGKRLGVIMGRHKYIYDLSHKVEEVYDLKLDPGEKKNRVDALPEVLQSGRCFMNKSGVSLGR